MKLISESGRGKDDLEDAMAIRPRGKIVISARSTAMRILGILVPPFNRLYLRIKIHVKGPEAASGGPQIALIGKMRGDAGVLTLREDADFVLHGQKADRPETEIRFMTRSPFRNN
jgi:hypothetical protein